MMLRVFSARVALPPNEAYQQGGVYETKPALMQRLEDFYPFNQEEI